MLGAFARAYAVLGDESYRAAAEKNLAFLKAKLWRPPAKSEMPADALSSLARRRTRQRSIA